MNDIEQKLVELIEKFENLTVELGPEVVEIGLMAARVDAAQHIVWGFLALLFAVGLTWFPRKAWAATADWDFNDVEARTFIIGLAGLPSIVFTIISLDRLFNVWNWAGVIEPKLWIAKQVLGW